MLGGALHEEEREVPKAPEESQYQAGKEGILSCLHAVERIAALAKLFQTAADEENGQRGQQCCD